MNEESIAIEPQAPQGIGEQLRAAREQRGLTLEQVAAETRIPQRHLIAIEAGEFGKLPGRTYAVGFSRTYAKLLGFDPDEAAEEVRAELDSQTAGEHRRPSFEPGDPARVPSRALGWFAAFAVLLLLAGGFVFFRTIFSPAAELPPLSQPAPPHPHAARPAAAVPPAGTAGPVTFTALEDGVWVKFYDGSGKQLMQKLMAKGERYTVPPDVQNPQIWTGRPDALAITVGGRPVPKLADRQQVMKDVPITAAALLARVTPTPTPTATAAPAPTPAAAPTGEKPAPAAT